MSPIDIPMREFEAARERVRGFVHRTPVERSAWLSDLAGHDIYLKLECWQRTRSFKMRGAYNAIAALTVEERRRGLVTASAGNHGQAVALAARELGAQATIFVPSTAPQTKKNRIRAFGATLREDEATYDDAEIAAQHYAREVGAVFVHAFSDPNVVAGQGTIGFELLEQLPQVQAVITPVGGGGLIAGIGAVLKDRQPAVRLAGVQSNQTTAMYDAFQAGGIVDSPIPPTLADGLAGCTDAISYQRAHALIDDMLLVEEAALPAALAGLYRHDGVVAEGAAATTVAALTTGVLRVAGPAVLIISGGNIDAGKLAALLASH